MKLLSLFLVFIMLLTCIVACGTDNGKKSTEGVDTTTQSEDDTAELDTIDIRRAIPDDLPNINYNGKAFRILARERSDFVNDIGANLEETGDIVNDSVYSRNMTVEERFNIKIMADHASGDPNVKLKNTVFANEDAYDIMLGQAIETGNASIDGNFVDWYKDLPYVNLEKPWYIGNAREALSVKNHSYLMIGEYCLSVLRFTYCMYFNKNLAEIYQIDDIYNVVYEGDWTINRLDEMVKNIYKDVNGDNIMDENDLYGFSTDYYSAAIAYQYGFNNPIMKWNNEGIPEMQLNIPKTVAIVEKLYNFFWNNPGSYPGTWGVTGPIWEAGRVLFINGLFSNSSSYRNYEFDYGLIPYPKWDDEQTNYYSMSDGAHDVMAVPITISDPEFTSIIIEALNAETYKQVVPALYDVAFKVKYARDETVTEILDMILAGRFFDFGYIYDGWNGVAFLTQDCLSNKSSDYASKYAARETKALAHYEKIINSILALDS